MNQALDSASISYTRRAMDALRLDPVLLSLLIILALFGSMVLYSASGSDQAIVIRQSTRIVFALLLMIAVANIPLRMIRKISIWLYLAGVAMLVAVMFYGEVGKGAQRWLDLGVVRFQPSEILKLAVPMIVATYLANRVLPAGLKELVVSSILVMIPVLLIARQPDLGTAILVGSAGFFVLFLAGVRWRVIISLGVLMSAMAPLLWKFALHDYQRKRILTLLDPETDPLGSGYHIIQSKIAIGSGGVYGKGNPVQDSDWFGWCLWQGMAEWYTIAAGLYSGKIYRLYLFCIWRRIRFLWQYCVDFNLPGNYLSRTIYRSAFQGKFRASACRCT